MILVEVALAWLVLSLISVIVTAALGRAATRSDSQALPQRKARLDAVDGFAHTGPIESRLAAHVPSPTHLSFLSTIRNR
jgi:hypothetical protein